MAGSDDKDSNIKELEDKVLNILTSNNDVVENWYHDGVRRNWTSFINSEPGKSFIEYIKEDDPKYTKDRLYHYYWNWHFKQFDRLVFLPRIAPTGKAKEEAEKRIDEHLENYYLEQQQFVELCGNTVIGQFIHEKDLKWIPYCGFENIKYLDKGGFGIVYKATWLENKKEVVLKCLNQLKSNMDLDEFLNEWKYHCQVINSNAIINVYGITKDPDTSKHMVVMDYANEGNLRGSLTKIIKSNWNEKLHILYEIICGLDEIHKKKLIHCDFHDGNILNHTDETSKFYVSDLGLSQPVKSFLKKENDNIYGVMPFMAPEVLRGEPYTPASDIYSFSMIMWEFTSGVTPFNDRAHDLQLSLSICTGERPEIIKSTPQCYVDLMEKCWDENPLERPSSSDVSYVIKGWICRYSYSVKSEKLRGNIMEFISAPIERKFNTKSHPQAYNISHSFDFTSSELNNKLSECLECQIVD